MSADTDRIRERLAALVERLNASTDEHPEAAAELKPEIDHLRHVLRLVERTEQEAPCE